MGLIAAHQFHYLLSRDISQTFAAILATALSDVFLYSSDLFSPYDECFCAFVALRSLKHNPKGILSLSMPDASGSVVVQLSRLFHLELLLIRLFKPKYCGNAAEVIFRCYLKR